MRQTTGASGHSGAPAIPGRILGAVHGQYIIGGRYESFAPKIAAL
jgi:hypothetical protein